ncbi:MAG: hemolysin III family protein [Clostridiales bacterium]|nr:hemolysin III family protein [Clostridiales bacterium]
MRIPLIERHLPGYTRGEEIFHMVSHIAGGVFAFVALLLCVVKSSLGGSAWAIASSIVYGITMIVLYCLSSVYHGLKPSLGKKVLQVLDHCSIYFMIAGTYTPILLMAMRPLYPAVAWAVFGAEWALTALAVTLTAIDLRQYRVFSMFCYLFMGWAIVFVAPYAVRALSGAGFWLLLSGGFAYTLGAILYGLGSKRRWFHALFHLFVLAGSVLQFLAIFLYVI